MSVYLTPKETQTHYRLMDPPMAPVVHIQRKALNDMAKLVDLAKGEVGWMCTVIDRGVIDQVPHYEIDAVYLFEQRVHGATTEISSASIAEISFKILHEDGYDENKRINRMYCWGHSHVNMETNPSSQDELQMNMFRENGMDVAIRLIANKHGNVRIDVFDYKNAIVFTTCTWDIVEETGLSQNWEAMMKTMVKQIEPVVTKKGGKGDPLLLEFMGNGNRKGNRKQQKHNKKNRQRNRNFNNSDDIDPAFLEISEIIRSKMAADEDQDVEVLIHDLLFMDGASDDLIIKALDFTKNDWADILIMSGEAATHQEAMTQAHDLFECINARIR